MEARKKKQDITEVYQFVTLKTLLSEFTLGFLSKPCNKGTCKEF